MESFISIVLYSGKGWEGVFGLLNALSHSLVDNLRMKYMSCFKVGATLGTHPLGNKNGPKPPWFPNHCFPNWHAQSMFYKFYKHVI